MKLKKLNRFIELPGRDRRLLLESLLLLSITVIGMRTLGFRTVLALTKRCQSRVGGLRPGNAAIVASAAAAMERASRVMHMGTCLTRSLALSVLLARRGVNTTLRIGVDKQANGIAAHAWLERPEGPVHGHTGHSFDATFAPKAAGAAVSS